MPYLFASMVLISSNQNDFTTNVVIDWLYYNKVSWTRVNPSDEYFFSFGSEGIVLFHKDKSLKLKFIDSYWYRRGKIELRVSEMKNSSPESNERVVLKQREIIEEFLQFKFENRNSVGRYSISEPNKLIILEEAKKLNMIIPNSYIIERKEDLFNLEKKESEIITKTITGSSVFQFEDNIGIIYTNRLDSKSYDIIPTDFFPSLVQCKIQKKYELRVFFLKDKFWAMAIFSQKDEKTKEDYRRYNQEKANRNVPYLLPNELKDKLRNLMVKIGQNSGSIDLIVSTDNKYYFLEVNPIGQFGDISHICNFHLEKEIAIQLSKDEV